MLVKKPLFNFLPLCSLRLEWLDKLLLNHRGTEEGSCVGGFPDLSKLPVAQREKTRFFESP